MKKAILFFALLAVVFLAGCTVEIGDKCVNGPFEYSCVTDNCVENICSKSDLGGSCQENNHCNKGYCVLDKCRNPSDLGGVCEYDYHCQQGVCKNNICELGKNGDRCDATIDCKEGFICENDHCVNNKLSCQAARALKLNQLSLGWGIFLLLIGIGGAVLGITIPGITIAFKGINIILSIVALGAGLIVIGAIIGGSCF